jgi:hypothetical protein
MTMVLSCKEFVLSRDCMVHGFVMSRVCCVQDLLCPGFVVSRVCTVVSMVLACLEFAVSRILSIPFIVPVDKKYVIKTIYLESML